MAAYGLLGLLAAELLPPGRWRQMIMTAGLVLGVLLGLSRLYLGVHYPTDVLAGWAAGLAIALLAWEWARGQAGEQEITPPPASPGSRGSRGLPWDGLHGDR